MKPALSPSCFFTWSYAVPYAYLQPDWDANTAVFYLVNLPEPPCAINLNSNLQDLASTRSLCPAQPLSLLKAIALAAATVRDKPTAIVDLYVWAPDAPCSHLPRFRGDGDCRCLGLAGQPSSHAVPPGGAGGEALLRVLHA